MSVRRVVAEAQASDLDPRNCEVLLGLAARGPATVTEIADLLELSRSTVSHSLRLLDRGGLTQKTADATDKPKQIRSLRSAGRQFAARLIELWDPPLG